MCGCPARGHPAGPHTGSQHSGTRGVKSLGGWLPALCVISCSDHASGILPALLRILRRLQGPESSAMSGLGSDQRMTPEPSALTPPHLMSFCCLCEASLQALQMSRAQYLTSAPSLPDGACANVPIFQARKLTFGLSVACLQRLGRKPWASGYLLTSQHLAFVLGCPTVVCGVSMWVARLESVVVNSQGNNYSEYSVI